jgi:ceramide glucosyltransferase
MEIVSLSLLFLVALSLCYSLYAFFCSWIFFRKNGGAKENAGKALPPVSIVKPLSNIEDGTLGNLMSFCDQDYPNYEVIFSLSQEGKSIIFLLEELKKVFPYGDIRWTIVNQNKGPNYKVETLIGAVRETKYEIIALSDGDMRVERNYLKQIVPLFLQEKVGLVTCLYRGANIRNIFGGLHSLTVQTDFIPNVLIDHRLEGISYAFGATILTSKEVLASFGGLKTLQEYLADDYQMGYQVRKKGYGIHLSPYLADHIFCAKNFREYFLHHLRWAITQRICRPIGYLASVITHGVFLALLFLILEGFSPTAVALFLFICGIRVLSFIFLNKALIHNDEVTCYFWLIPMNDLLNSVIWFLSLFINTVRWKNRQFRVLKGGRIVQV